MAKNPPEFHGPPSGDELRDWDAPHSLPSSEGDHRRVEIHRKRLPFYGSPDVQNVRFANGFAELAAVALARAEFYGALLAEQYEAEGLAGLIGAEMGGGGGGGGGKELGGFGKCAGGRAVGGPGQGGGGRGAPV